MFADCKVISMKLLLAVSIATGAMDAMAAEKDGSVKCGPGDECTTTATNDTIEAKNLCPSSSIQMSWNKKSDWTLVSCSCNCSEQNNNNWFVSRGGSVIGLEAGRYFPRSFFSSSLNPMVPDIMASHSMCKPADRKMVSQSAFILLDKKPSNEEKDPYCYDTIYVVDEGGVINFFENNKSIKKNDHSYFLDINESEKKDLISLVKKISPSWVVATDQAKEKYFTVIAEHAYLYDQPSAQGGGRAYLIAGDKVKTLGDPEGGYIKIRYVTKKGVAIEKWVKCDDINYVNQKN